MNYTKGPWWLDDDGFIASGSDDTYVTIADPHCSNLDIDEREANAKLIAAAPELLEIVVTIFNDIQNNKINADNGIVIKSLMWEKLNSIIKKSTL